MDRERRDHWREAMSAPDWMPVYEPWRHGGWYVGTVVYPSGAVGCVSRNYEDHKWRIVCDERTDSTGLPIHTFPNRDAAARAERSLALAEYEEGRH
jgi:hypothetical protein